MKTLRSIAFLFCGLVFAGAVGAQAPGKWTVVDYSDLHYRADDELRYEVGRASVTGNSDRFTLLFRKP